MAGEHCVPRGPVLDWASLGSAGSADIPALSDIGHTLLTTSGRAALYQALVASALPVGGRVLVPTYHCPTMVAPVLSAGGRAVFYPIDGGGLPNLDLIPAEAAETAHAMVVAHFFGRTQSLLAVRRWCDDRRIVLIEDCAHSFFGMAGDRPVGQWGDYAVASLTKFFPVPEAGLLVSATRPLPQPLARQGAKAQIKGVVDVFEQSQRARRLQGMGSALNWVFRMKNARRGAGGSKGLAGSPPDLMQGCDMARVQQAPLAISRWLYLHAARSRIVALRRAHHEQLRSALQHAVGAKVLFNSANGGAPYALALWVDKPEPVYEGLRARGMPVARWDRFWHGTPALAGDQGAEWRTHVLQLLCHQDLKTEEVARMATVVHELLEHA